MYDLMHKIKKRVKLYAKGFFCLGMHQLGSYEDPSVVLLGLKKVFVLNVTMNVKEEKDFSALVLVSSFSSLLKVKPFQSTPIK